MTVITTGDLTQEMATLYEKKFLARAEYEYVHSPGRADARPAGERR
jgi:hypothetical protein